MFFKIQMFLKIQMVSIIQTYHIAAIFNVESLTLFYFVLYGSIIVTTHTMVADILHFNNQYRI